MIKLVLFDLDDTLFNATELTKFARTDALNEMLKLGLRITMREALVLLGEVVKEYGSNYGRHFNVLLRRLHHADPSILAGQPPDKYVAAAVIAYHRVKVKFIAPYKDVVPTLVRLKKECEGLKLGILTDGIPVKQYEKVLRLRLDKYFDTIVVSDEIGIRKPNHKLWLYCVEKAGVEPWEVVHVGDRLDRDVAPAKKAGVHAVLIHRGGKHDPYTWKDHVPDPETEPDFHVRKMGEVLDVVRKLNERGRSGAGSKASEEA
ncbi:MAG: TIGR02253 family HAD-type hydrolase [Promethearchaeota archaeon]